MCDLQRSKEKILACYGPTAGLVPARCPDQHCRRVGCRPPSEMESAIIGIFRRRYGEPILFLLPKYVGSVLFADVNRFKIKLYPIFKELLENKQFLTPKYI